MHNEHDLKEALFIQGGLNKYKTFDPVEPISREAYRRSEFPPLVNSVHSKIYMIGSLKNVKVQVHAMTLRVAFPEWEVFDDWQAAHPKADDEWRAYELSRGRTYEEALRTYAGQNVFQFDKKHLNEATHGLLVLPAGKSGHLELGYLAGQGKATAILLDADYDRWDVMYAFADIVTRDLTEIIDTWSSV